MRLSIVMTGLFYMASSAAFALPKAPEFDTTHFAKMKNKTAAEFFCAKPTTYQIITACGELKKNKGNLNSKSMPSILTRSLLSLCVWALPL